METTNYTSPITQRKLQGQGIAGKFRQNYEKAGYSIVMRQNLKRWTN